MATDKDIVYNIEVKNKSAKTVKQVNNDLKQLENTTKTVKVRLRELEDEMAEIGTVGSPQFQKLAKEAGALRDQVNNAKAATKAYSADFPKLQLGVEAFKAIGGAAQVAMGATALLGDGNEELQRSIQKLMAIQNVMNGINSLTNLISDESLIGIKAKIFLDKVLGENTKKLTIVQRIFNKVMSANPIMLIVVGIGLLIGAFVLLEEKIKSIIEFFRRLFTAEGRAEKAREEQSIANSKRTQKRIDEIREEHKEFVKAKEKENEVLNKKIEINENLGKSSFALRLEVLENNKAEVQSHIDSVAEIVKAKLALFELQRILNGQTEDEFKKSLEAQGIFFDDLMTQVTVLQKDLALDLEVMDTRITKAKNDENKKRVSDNKKANDEINKANENLQKEELKRIRDRQKARINLILEIEKIENEFLNSQLSAQQQEINAVEDKFFRLQELAIQDNLDTQLLEEAHQAELAAIDEKFRQQKKEADDAAAENKKALDAQELQDEFDKTSTKLQLAEDVANATTNLAQGVFAITNAFGKQDEKSQLRRAKRQFQVSKALQLAQAAINGAQAVTAILSVPDFTMGIASAIRIGAAAAATVATIAKIASTQFKGGGGGGSSTGSGAAATIASSVQASTGAQGGPNNTALFGTSGDFQTETLTPGGGSSELPPIIIENIISSTDMTVEQSSSANIRTRASID